LGDEPTHLFGLGNVERVRVIRLRFDLCKVVKVALYGLVNLFAGWNLAGKNVITITEGGCSVWRIH
jgi:hypothetical protein